MESEAVANNQDLSPLKPDRVSGKMSRSRRLRHKTSQRLILASALAVSLIVLFFESVYYFSETAKLRQTNAAIQSQLEKVEQELVSTKSALDQSRHDLEQVVHERLPDLHELEPDKVLPLNAAYVRNIVFNVIQRDGQRKYEYKLILENKSGLEVRPEFKVIVFDKFGVQVGVDDVQNQKGLPPGESRSYSSAIGLFLDKEPRYFVITGKGFNGNKQSGPAAMT